MTSASSASASKKKKKPESSNARQTRDVPLSGGVENEQWKPIEEAIVASKCYVCGGSEDEDLILVCDNKKGCNNEAHMYCLDPILTRVPEGDWFCDFCDEWGTTRQLRAYFEEFHKVHSIPTKKTFYHIWLESLQYQYIMVDQLKHSYSSSRFQSDISPEMDLIGCPVSLLISGVDEDMKKSHTGRIVLKRGNEELGRVEHLVHFKSGADGRNKSHLQWLCLDEHSCFARTQLVWIRVSSSYSSYTPGQRCCRSALYKARLQYKVDARARLSGGSSTLPSTGGLTNNNAVSSSGSSFYYLFGEEEVIEVRKKETVVPFEDRLRQSSLNLAKKQSLCYAFACAELEESQSVLRAYHLMSREDIEVIGATADGVTSGDLKALSELTAAHMVHFPVNNGNIPSGNSSKKFELPFSGEYSELRKTVTAAQFKAISGRHGQRRKKLTSDWARIRSAELGAEAEEDHSDRLEVSQCLVSLVDKVAGAVMTDEDDEPAMTSFSLSDHLLALDLPLLALEYGLSLPSQQQQQQQQLSAVDMCLPCTPAASAGASVKSAGTAGVLMASYRPVDFLDTVSGEYADFVKAQHAAFLERRAKEREAREEKKRARAESARRAREMRQKQLQELTLRQQQGNSVKASRRDSNDDDNEEDEWSEEQDQSSSSLFQLGEMTRRGLRNFLRSGGGGSVPPELLDELLAPEAAAGGGAVKTRSTRAQRQQQQPVEGRQSSISSGAANREQQQHQQQIPAKKPKKGYVDVHSEIVDFAAEQESAPQLLSDVERSSWPGTIVTDLERAVIGRVVFFESGWTVVRTLRGVLRARPYELELVPEGSDEFRNFEDAEILLIDSEETGGTARGGEGAVTTSGAAATAGGSQASLPQWTGDSTSCSSAAGQPLLPQLHYALDEEDLLLDFDGPTDGAVDSEEDGFESDEEAEYDDLYDDVGDVLVEADDFNLFSKTLDASPQSEKNKGADAGIRLIDLTGDKSGSPAAEASNKSTTGAPELHSTRELSKQKLKPSRIKYIETLPPSIAARIRKKTHIPEAQSSSSSSNEGPSKALSTNTAVAAVKPFQFKRWNRQRTGGSSEGPSGVESESLARLQGEDKTEFMDITRRWTEKPPGDQLARLGASPPQQRHQHRQVHLSSAAAAAAPAVMRNRMTGAVEKDYDVRERLLQREEQLLDKRPVALPTNAVSLDPRLRKMQTSGSAPTSSAAVSVPSKARGTTTIITEDGEELVVIDRRDEDDEDEEEDVRRNEEPATYRREQQQQGPRGSVAYNRMDAPARRSLAPFGISTYLNSRQSALRTPSSDESDQELRRNTDLNRRIETRKPHTLSTGAPLTGSPQLLYSAKTREGKTVSLFRPPAYQQTFQAQRKFAVLDDDYNLFETSEIVHSNSNSGEEGNGSASESSTSDSNTTAAAVDALLHSVAASTTSAPDSGLNSRKRTSRFDMSAPLVTNPVGQQQMYQPASDVDLYVSEEDYLRSAGFITEEQMAALNQQLIGGGGGSNISMDQLHFLQQQQGTGVMDYQEAPQLVGQRKKSRFDEPPPRYDFSSASTAGYNGGPSAMMYEDGAASVYGYNQSSAVADAVPLPQFQEFAVVQADTLISAQQQTQTTATASAGAKVKMEVNLNDDDDELVSCDGSLEEGEVDESKPEERLVGVNAVSAAASAHPIVNMQGQLAGMPFAVNPVVPDDFNQTMQPFHELQQQHQQLQYGFNHGSAAMMMQPSVEVLQANLMLEQQQQQQLELQQQLLLQHQQRIQQEQEQEQVMMSQGSGASFLQTNYVGGGGDGGGAYQQGYQYQQEMYPQRTFSNEFIGNQQSSGGFASDYYQSDANRGYGDMSYSHQGDSVDYNDAYNMTSGNRQVQYGASNEQYQQPQQRQQANKRKSRFDEAPQSGVAGGGSGRSSRNDEPLYYSNSSRNHGVFNDGYHQNNFTHSYNDMSQLQQQPQQQYMHQTNQRYYNEPNQAHYDNAQYRINDSNNHYQDRNNSYSSSFSNNNPRRSRFSR